MKIYDLPVMEGRGRSFYGKAQIIEKDDGEKVLQSYNTEVCKITSSGEFVRMWSGYSNTTMRHVNSFLSFFGLSGGGKSWWTAQPVEEKEKRPGPDMTAAESYRAMMGRRYAGRV